jgi:hypothetical protein
LTFVTPRQPLLFIIAAFWARAKGRHGLLGFFLGAATLIKLFPVNFLLRLAGRSKVSGTVRGTVLSAYLILSTALRYARE